MKIVSDINAFVYIVLTIFYCYQGIYVIIALLGKKKKKNYNTEAKTLHKYAFIIAARNENAVIGNLIDSIKNQNYPSELIDVIVVADNCTDNTAEISRQHGAIVYERFNNILIGKGYAMDYVFNKICEERGDYTCYDGYFVFDADNIIDVNYVREMNKVFDSGYKVVTSYRNSKNYDTNWITAGYSLWFIREAKYLNNPRMMIKTSCAVSGTGYLVDSSIIKKNHGWKFLMAKRLVIAKMLCSMMNSQQHLNSLGISVCVGQKASIRYYLSMAETYSGQCSRKRECSYPAMI